MVSVYSLIIIRAVVGILGEMLDPSVIMGKPIEYGYEYYHNPQHKENDRVYLLLLV